MSPQSSIVKESLVASAPPLTATEATGGDESSTGRSLSQRLGYVASGTVDPLLATNTPTDSSPAFRPEAYNTENSAIAVLGPVALSPFAKVPGSPATNPDATESSLTASGTDGATRDGIPPAGGPPDGELPIGEEAGDGRRDQINMDQLRALIASDHVKGSPHPDSNVRLTVYNYTRRAQDMNEWTPLTEQCRGLILDEDGYIEARPFANMHELEEDEELPTGTFEVAVKYDGSLGIQYYIDGVPYLATRGRFDSRQAMRGTEMLRQYANYPFRQDATYLWEIIYPDNKLVVDYGDEEKIVLLGIIETATGRELPLPDDTPFEVAERTSQYTSAAELRATEVPNAEGYVVIMTGGEHAGERYKVKFREYEERNSIRTGDIQRAVPNPKSTLKELLSRQHRVRLPVFPGYSTIEDSGHVTPIRVADYDLPYVTTEGRDRVLTSTVTMEVGGRQVSGTGRGLNKVNADQAAAMALIHELDIMAANGAPGINSYDPHPINALDARSQRWGFDPPRYETSAEGGNCVVTITLPDTRGVLATFRGESPLDQAGRVTKANTKAAKTQAAARAKEAIMGGELPS